MLSITDRHDDLIVKPEDVGIRTAFAVAFRPMNENSGGSLLHHNPTTFSITSLILHQPPPSSGILFLPKRLENTLVTPLKLRMFMGDDDHQFSAGA
ncbi:hypothetical protein EVAR_52698_1 [Eumeta japonica]|uniref:Uncharacterized protein n=1 Tax=Eumeta variegata TaxID=151549 RepID=A0A4C1Y0J8_EUMVA|nr:hypothetical protein EVAR_52698_1 [Eumeta japonica]